MPIAIHKKKKNKEELLTKEEKTISIVNESTSVASHIEVFRIIKNNSDSKLDNIISDESSFICGSDNSAVQQCEEIEVLESIFDNNLIIIRSPPKQIGDPTCKFQIILTSDQFSKINSWNDQLSLVFTMTDNYPISSPIIEINSGSLSMFDFNSGIVIIGITLFYLTFTY